MITKRVNRGACWLAAGVLGTVVFAAVALAVQDHYSKKIHHPEVTVKSGSADVEISPQANSSPRIDVAASTPTQVPRLVPKTDLQSIQANADSRRLEHRPDPRRVIIQHVSRPKSKSPVRLTTSEVKKRLVALWHQSLARKAPHGWNLIANSKDRPKKVSYTSSIKN